MIFMHGSPKSINLGSIQLQPRQIYYAGPNRITTAEGSVEISVAEMNEVRKVAIVLPKSQYAKAPAAVVNAENSTKVVSAKQPKKAEDSLRKFSPKHRPYKLGGKTGSALKIKPVKAQFVFGKSTIVNPPSESLLKEVAKISQYLGNKFKPSRSFWLGSGKSSFFVNHKTGPLIVLAERDIAYAMKELGGTRLNTIGAILNHEFAHWAHDSIIAKLDNMNFRKECGSKPIYDMSQHSRNYAWYFEQFAVLVEYGRFGASLRPLKSLNGLEIVAKYFDLPYLEEYIEE